MNCDITTEESVSIKWSSSLNSKMRLEDEMEGKVLIGTHSDRASRKVLIDTSLSPNKAAFIGTYLPVIKEVVSFFHFIKTVELKWCYVCIWNIECVPAVNFSKVSVINIFPC